MLLGYTQMNRLGDDLLSQIFTKLPWHGRARLASVCRRWRTVSTSTHAAIVWQRLSIDEARLGFDRSRAYGSLVQWCRALGCHVQDLQLQLSKPAVWSDLEDSEDEAVNSTQLLIDICTILFATSSQLLRLSVFPNRGSDTPSSISLPWKLIVMISTAPALESLTMALPSKHNFKALADTVCSLRKLKVARLDYLGHALLDARQQPATTATESLLSALCSCPLLEELQLLQSPAQLSAATRLTLLALQESSYRPLSIAADVLPCSLQRLRLTERMEHDAALRSHYHTALHPQHSRLQRDFGGLSCLQDLQLTVYSWGVQSLPPGLQSLRLEASATDHGVMFNHGALLNSISCLVHLKKLHFHNFEELGQWRAEVAAALRPLTHLQALAFDACSLHKNPASNVVSRLSLLSLRNNRLTTVADVLPSDAVQNLRVLDISGNLWGQPPRAHTNQWTAANLAAFSSRQWPSLWVLGIRPWPGQGSSSLRATADALQQVLQQQAAAALPSRPPPIVVHSDVRQELLLPADDLAVVD